MRSIALEQEASGNAVAASARIVVVGVKPAMVPDLLDEIAPHLREDAIVVSIAAGVTLATFAAHLPAGTRVLRSMPNTPPPWAVRSPASPRPPTSPRRSARSCAACSRPSDP